MRKQVLLCLALILISARSDGATSSENKKIDSVCKVRRTLKVKRGDTLDFECSQGGGLLFRIETSVRNRQLKNDSRVHVIGEVKQTRGETVAFFRLFIFSPEIKGFGCARRKRIILLGKKTI